MNKTLKDKTHLTTVSPLEPILSGYVSVRQEGVECSEKQTVTPGNMELIIGECLDDQHPSINGRVLVGWQDADNNQIEMWLPTLQGMAVRKMDRLLVQQPANWPEPVVFGVLDGCLDRPEKDLHASHRFELKTDEAVRIDSQNGQPLIEIFQQGDQPVVRLLSEDVNLDLNGKLNISADSIGLKAKRGNVEISSECDVVVKGELIELN